MAWAFWRSFDEQKLDIPAIVTTAFGEVSVAVQAMRAGAEDYLTKPIDFDALLLAVERALQRREVAVEAENLRRQLRDRDQVGLEGLIGASPAMQRIYRMAKQVAGSRATVLITGESGTGKGELARALHHLSTRANAPFVTLHCAALAESAARERALRPRTRRLHRRRQAPHRPLRAGGRRHALPRRDWRDPARHAGEAPARPPGADVRARRRQRDDQGRRARSSRRRTAISPTRCVRAAFARISTTASTSSTSRCRRSACAATTCSSLAEPLPAPLRAENQRAVDGFSDAARAKLHRHRWPGNVRELENAIERAVVLCEGDTVEPEALPVRRRAGDAGRRAHPRRDHGGDRALRDPEHARGRATGRPRAPPRCSTSASAPSSTACTSTAWWCHALADTERSSRKFVRSSLRACGPFANGVLVRGSAADHHSGLAAGKACRTALPATESAAGRTSKLMVSS